MNEPLYELRSGKGESAPLWIFEKPIPGCKYTIGGDAARGLLDDDGVARGDFSAAVGFNAHTGAQAFTYAARVRPSEFAWILRALGFMYFKAMLNPEMTGGDGAQVFQLLRDKYHYPNMYGWLGKNEKLRKQKATTGGWETTYKSRQRMLVTFRQYLQPEKGEDVGFLKIRDKRLFQQMSFATAENQWFDWQIKRGHDDIFIAACLAVMALHDYPPPKSAGDSVRLLDTQPQQSSIPFQTEPAERLRERWLVSQGYKKPIVEDRLQGVW